MLKSIKKKWMLGIIALILIAISLGVYAAYNIGVYGANRASYEWLRSEFKNQFPKYIDARAETLKITYDILLKDAEFLRLLQAGNNENLNHYLAEKFKKHNQIYCLLPEATDFVSKEKIYQISRLKFTEEAYLLLNMKDKNVFIGIQKDLPIGSRMHRLFLGEKLNDYYIDKVAGITSTEAVLFDKEGYITGSVKNLQKKRVSVATKLYNTVFTSNDFLFLEDDIQIPDGYLGYNMGDNPFSVGDTVIEAYSSAVLLTEKSMYPLGMIFFIPKEIMLIGPKYASIMLSISSFLIIFPLVSLIGWRFVKKLTEPIVELSDATLKVTEGDLSFSLPVKRDDEIGELTAHFNSMVKNLKASRERILQSEKLAAIGQLAGGIAHEINNPLGVILGFAQSLDKRIPEGDPLRLPVDSILRESLRSKELVQDLLTFSRSSKSTKESFNLNLLIRQTFPLLEARAKIENIVLNFNEKLQNPNLFGNKGQIQQILVNLCNNSLDAMPSGGVLTISSWNEEKNICFSVADTGTGIGREIQNKIFEPFFTTKETGKGTGLGLALVYEIVQQHNGKINLESEEGKGCCFTITFPTESNGK